MSKIRFTKTVMVCGVLYDAGAIVESSAIPAGSLQSLLYVRSAEYYTEPPAPPAPKPAPKPEPTAAPPAPPKPEPKPVVPAKQPEPKTKEK